MSWEYADLFDVRIGEPEQLTLWTAASPTVTVGRMGYRTRTIKAGPRLEIDIYPIWGREDAGRARRAKKQNATPERIQRANEARNRHLLVLLADANFTAKDQHVTLTYSGPDPSYDNTLKFVRNFLNRIKRARSRKGLPPLKYIYSVEDNEDGKPVKRHVHMLMSGGLTREEIEALWGKGFANVDRLQPTERGLEAIAMYITKQQRNRHRWCASKNLKRPGDPGFKVRVSNTKVSNSRVERIAASVENNAKEVLQKLYPDYQFVECRAYGSDILPGVYIKALMRKNERRRIT